MKLPLFWAKGSYENEFGETFTCWKWSEVSDEDALNKANEAAKSLAARVASGEHPDHYYTNQPLREEILKEFRDTAGRIYAAITLNAYGCEVLNSASIMFVDIDLPPISFFQKISYGIRRLFNSRAKHPKLQSEEEAFSKLKAMLDADKECGVRIYRTFAGFRYMMTHALIEPNSDSTKQAMEFLGSDPLYIRMCTVQESFRARLTPKSWRMGLKSMRAKFPREKPEEKNSFIEWQKKYRKLSDGYSTCRFIENLGNPVIHPEIQPILKLHDEVTNALSKRPLA